MKFEPGKIIEAPPGKGFVIFRGDAGFGEKPPFGYKEGSPIPFHGRQISWTTSRKVAERFAQGIAEHYGEGYTPMVMTGVIRRIQVSPIFWGMENEVFPLKSKSVIKSIETLGRRSKFGKTVSQWNT